MQSARQILAGVLLGAIEERAKSARPRRRKVSPDQMELAWGAPIESTHSMLCADPGRPLTDDELLAEFNRLFPET